MYCPELRRNSDRVINATTRNITPLRAYSALTWIVQYRNISRMTNVLGGSFHSMILRYSLFHRPIRANIAEKRAMCALSRCTDSCSGGACGASCSSSPVNNPSTSSSKVTFAQKYPIRSSSVSTPIDKLLIGRCSTGASSQWTYFRSASRCIVA